MSYLEYSYTLNGNGQYHPLDQAMQPSVFDGGHHYNFPDEPNPYPNSGHIPAHQPVSRYQLQDIRNDFDRHTKLHSIPSHSYTDPPEWPPLEQKPCRTFPTPAYVYEHCRNASDRRPMDSHFDLDPLSFPRATLAGSLDPTTGIFYRTPEHPRLRTAQACEKCRTRKAKCSGEHPACKRCINRNLVCEYAREGRIRGPNKPKPKAVGSNEEFPTGGIQSNTSRDATPSHLATSSPNSNASDQMAAGGPIQEDASGDHLSQTSFADHRSLHSRPSSLRLGSRRSPSANVRRPRQDNYGTLYSTTPLQSPTSPLFNSSSEAISTNNTPTSFLQSTPRTPDGRHYPAAISSHTYEQPVSVHEKEMYSDAGVMFTDVRHPNHYSTASTDFDYGTEFTGSTSDALSTHQGVQPLPGVSSGLYSSFDQSPQQYVGVSSHWTSQSNGFPHM